MPRVAKILPFKTPQGWRVNVPKSLAADGKRHKKLFATPTAAEKFAARLRAAYASGHRGSLIPATVALQATEALRILEGTGLSLVEAARLARGKVSSAGAAETFAARFARVLAANEARWSTRYRLDMERIPRWVPSLMGRACGTIDRAVIEAALGPLARSTLDMRSARVLAVLGWRERHHKSTEIHILTPGQCGRLLRACECAAERRAVALLLFAGIRPDAEHGEIRRLDWSAVGAAEIYVSREVSKVSDRLVPITPRLLRLLRGHPATGTVTPANWKRVWQRLRAAAGITVADVCRHTFASHALAAWGEDATKAAMGHTAASSTLFRHYRRAVGEADGRRFFR